MPRRAGHTMGIKLAETAGFCMGVKRAVDLVLDVAQRKGKETVFTYGPLIHNPQTVALLKRRGIVPITSLDELGEEARGSLIILRAHGVSPAVRKAIKEKGLRIVDATCPKVGHVQGIIKKHAAQGYHLLIVGDEAHPEVNGLLGYASGRGIVVSSAGAVGDLPEMARVCVVAQTTQDMDTFQEITDHIRRRFPHAVVFDTICDSTEKRQREVRELAAEMDAMIIVGGRNSANTQRLAALSRSQGVPSFHIETPEELDGAVIGAFQNIGISAGASTPNWIIDRVVADVASMQQAKTGKAGGLFKLWTIAVRTDVYSALGAACLTVAAVLLQDLPLRFPYPAIAALYVYAMHTINRIVDRRSSTVLGSFREASYERHKGRYLGAAALSLVGALALAASVGLAPFLLLLVMSVLGALYNTCLLYTS
ncbi:MAG: 4-hydroxy-3-methylbut-2-enyl diphosphate reductase, partial [Syntrophales bacterium]|nr:4-hydroxy-3-methylbut-2-enyl diphosphate reductase [Syntrophales bacterium]